MRVAYLIAGAGGMYCGTCLRDNRLAAALRRQGRDFVLIPLYTPIRTDETDVSEGEVSYGGISLYLQQEIPLFRSLPAVFDRLLSARWLLRTAGRLAGRTRPDQLGALTVSVLQGSNGYQVNQLRRLIERLQEVCPTIIHLPNLMFVGVARDLKESLNVTIFCSLAGEDVFLDALRQPYRQQALALIRDGAADVDVFVAPTRYYASHAASHFGLDAALVHYVPMGIDVHDTGDPAPSPHDDFTIGYLARICPEKGLHVLCETFARLRQAGRRCRLRAAGYLGPADRAYYKDILANLRLQGLAERFEYVGEVTRQQKLAFLSTLHVLSVPTVYRESKGLYVLEAMACGVPVVQPRHGSFPELIEATGGGLLYDPNESGTQAEALARLMEDGKLRNRLAAEGAEAVHNMFTTELMASKTWALYEKHAASRVHP